MGLLELSKKYGKDEYRLLKENPALENLSFFSSLGLGATEWIKMNKGDSVLFLGSQMAILLELSQSKRLSIYEEDSEKLDSVRTVLGDAAVFLSDYAVTDFSQFDVIIAYGSRYVSKLISGPVPDAKLVLIFDNKYGLNYLAGDGGDDDALSVEEVRAWIGGKRYHTYYPYPNYRYVYKLFSDKRKPAAGELSQLKAYDYPVFAARDPGLCFDDIVEANDFDKFANSYILVTGGMEESVYIKYNRTRLPKYRIKTEIRYKNTDESSTADLLSEADACTKKDSGNIFVAKTALHPEGIPHIQAMKNAPELLKNRDVQYLEGITGGEGEIIFPFVEGESLSTLCRRKLYETGDVSELTEFIRQCLEKTVDKDAKNLDAIFDNFILGNGILTAIDYEWIFDEDMKLEADRRTFIKYRALSSFYHENSCEIRTRFGLDEAEFLAEFNIKDVQVCRIAEKAFQSYIHGDCQEVYLDNYFVEPVSHDRLKEIVEELPAAKRRIGELSDMNRDKDFAIREMTKIKALTDNHVHNLDIIIENLRRENEELAKTLNVYGGNLSFLFRLRRKLAAIYNRIYPEGSMERKRLRYRLMSLRHPVEYFKMTHSELGKNLMEGDFKIGDLYREKGKLEFSYSESPKVSIIIPVYNQIHYTYACLVSLLENTVGFEYEIIIADDVSTDATAEIDKFVSGLVIARNETNQGFLKNCNNAAKMARGEYIFFLNNDTTVGENWLKPLVELIESDDSIGMVGSKLIYPDGRLQEAGGIIWSDGSGWNYGRADDPDRHEYNYVRDVDYISGAAIMIGRSLWEEIGGFDTRYAPAYCEDSDLAFEVRKRGLRVVYQPLSVVTHFEGVSNGTDVGGSGLKRYQVENNKKLREKWAKELEAQYDNIGIPNTFRARERSRGKRIILFVDHYVPTFDKDAGSKTTFQYIRMFIERGFEVKFLPDNFLRSEPYTSLLSQMGVEVLYGEEIRANIFDWIEEHKADIHVAYLNRPHIAAKYIDFIRERTDIKVIYYGHDLHFLRERREYDLTGDEEKKLASAYWKSMELTIMKKADISYYPSNIEIDYIHTFDKRINAKAITAYVFEDFKDRHFEADMREGVLFVGGFSHPPNADGLRFFLESMWDEIYQKIHAPFYIVGSNASDEIKAYHNEKKGIIFKGFVSEEELKSLYERVRLAVVPLRYGAGVKGKVIEALYYGDPVITTSVGAEGINSEDGVMLIADEPADFIRETVTLYKDVERLERMHRAAVEYISKRHSIEAVWDIIKEDFE